MRLRFVPDLDSNHAAADQILPVFGLGSLSASAGPGLFVPSRKAGLFGRSGLAGSSAIAALAATDRNRTGTAPNRKSEQQSGTTAPGSGKAGVGTFEPADG